MGNSHYFRAETGWDDVTQYLTRFGIQRRAVAYPKGIYTGMTAGVHITGATVLSLLRQGM